MKQIHKLETVMVKFIMAIAALTLFCAAELAIGWLLNRIFEPIVGDEEELRNLEQAIKSRIP